MLCVGFVLGALVALSSAVVEMPATVDISSLDIESLVTVSEETDTLAKLTTAAEPLGVPGEYLVKLRNRLNNNDVQKHLNKASSVLGGFSTNGVNGASGCTVGNLMTIGKVRIYEANCNEEGIQALRVEKDAIAYIEQNQVVSTMQCDCPCTTPNGTTPSGTTPTPTTAAPTTTPGSNCLSYNIPDTNPDLWGLDRVNQPAPGVDFLMDVPGDGTGTEVFVVDTGIDISHTDFGGRAVFGASFITGQTGDGNGHGTHVAGTVGGNTYGIAKNTRLVAVKVLSDGGSGSYAGVIRGIEWCVANRQGTKSVMNLSLGGGAYQPVDDAINAAVAAGVVTAVAAGNSNRDACNYSPARATNALTVGATDSNDRRSSFSNWGRCLDIFAPGRGILSALPNQSSAAYSGTSMASPHVAGMAAAYLSSVSGDRTPAQVRTWLRQNAVRTVTGRRRSINRLLNSGC